MQSLWSLLFSTFLYFSLLNGPFYVVATLFPITCVVTSTTGCIDNSVYEFATQKVCGGVVQNKNTEGCCFQKTRFQYATTYCCNGASVEKTDGRCEKYSAAIPATCWDCSVSYPTSYEFLALASTSSSSQTDTDTVEEEVDNTLTSADVLAPTNVDNDATETKNIDISVAEHTHSSSSQSEDKSKSSTIHAALYTAPYPFNTRASTNPPNTAPCTYFSDYNPGPSISCLNTYSFDIAYHYACGDWILPNGDNGCCDGQKYTFSSQSCCVDYVGNTEKYVVINIPNYCKCQTKVCNPTNVPTERPNTPPTPQPSATYAPTGKVTHRPTHSPTVTFSPTVYVNVVANIEPGKVMKKNWLFGSLAVLVFLIGGIAYFQSRASHMIKQRHFVALEIAESAF